MNARVVFRCATFIALLGAVVMAPTPSVAWAQGAAAGVPRPRPRVKGRQFSVRLDSSPQQAAVYWDQVGPDGKADPKAYGVAGYTPLQLRLPKGVVRIVLEHPGGFQTFERDLDIARVQTLTFTMERAARAGRLDLRVSDEGAGAEVFINGIRRGTLPNVFELPAGRHQVEVAKEGFKTQSEWLEISEGERLTRDVRLEKAAAAAGSLLVLGEGEVWVDGTRYDAAPTLVSGLSAGMHVVEVRREGQTPFKQTVEVKPGQQTKITAQTGDGPPAAPTGRGTLRVQSPVPDAEVFLDGSSIGKAPVERVNLPPGKHFVVVQKEGYQDFRREVELVPGTPMVLIAELKAVGTLKFLSNPPGAQVFIDGELLPTVAPTSHPEVPAGERIVQMRLKGHFDWTETINVEGGRERIVSADLRPIPTGPSPDQVARIKRGLSSWGARAIPPGSFTADVGVGYPYLLMTRLAVGIWDDPRGPLRVDGGVGLRTFFQMTEFGVHGRVQLFEFGPLTLGARGEVGGGLGPNGRNTFYFDVGGLASLTFNHMITFSGFTRLNWYTDRLCPSQGDINRGIDPRRVCQDANWTQYFNKHPRDHRFSDTRIYAGGALEIAIDRYISGFIMVEFTPFQYEGRLAFKDDYNSIMVTRYDPLFYGTVGATFKF